MLCLDTAALRNVAKSIDVCPRTESLLIAPPVSAMVKAVAVVKVRVEKNFFMVLYFLS